MLGEQLAQLHQIEQPFFGWHYDNTIGSTPQYNSREDNWLPFFRQQRLQQQLTFATKNGYGHQLQDKGDKLSENLHMFFEGYHPSPSLLHGDLWGGNATIGNAATKIVLGDISDGGTPKIGLGATADSISATSGTGFYVRNYERTYERI